MPGDPKECRRLARQCVRLANASADVRLRADYLAFAHTWMQLAAVYESEGELIKSRATSGLNLGPLATQTAHKTESLLARDPLSAGTRSKLIAFQGKLHAEPLSSTYRA